MSRSRQVLVALLAIATLALGFSILRDGSEPSSAVEAREAGRDATREQELRVPSTTAGTVAATTTTIGRRGSGEAVTIAFGGDVHFEGVLRQKLAADPASLLAPVAPLLSAADLAVVNLETAITERGTAAPKEFTFRAPPAAFAALAAGGVDVASMANNHGMDYGVEGLEDSLDAAAAAGFPVIGIGRNAAEAYAPYRAVVRGQRIAVIGATQVLDGHLIATWTATDDRPGLASAKEVERLVAAVREARATSDTVVVFLHWGIERETCPSTVQQELARQLVDAGADVLVGGHAHRVQGAGRMDGAFVAYGLGNLVFYARPGPGARSGVLVVTVTGRDIDRYDWHPAEIRDGVPRPLDGDAADRARAEWAAARGCTGLAP